VKQYHVLAFVITLVIAFPAAVGGYGIPENGSFGVEDTQDIEIGSASYEYVSTECRAGDTFTGSVEAIATSNEDGIPTIDVMIMDERNFTNMRNARAYDSKLEANNVGTYEWSVAVESDSTWYAVYRNPHLRYSVTVRSAINVVNFSILFILMIGCITAVALAALSWRGKDRISRILESQKTKILNCDSSRPFYIGGIETTEVRIVLLAYILAMVYGTIMVILGDGIGIAIILMSVLSILSSLAAPGSDRGFGPISSTVGTFLFWSWVTGGGRISPYHYFLVDIILAVLSTFGAIFLLLRHWYWPTRNPETDFYDEWERGYYS
jgi:hypothetical protein